MQNSNVIAIHRNRETLLDHDQGELTDLFETLPVPTSPPEGAWHGTLMAITGLERLPRGLRAALARILDTPVNPWRGKTFDGNRGSNLWLPGVGARFAHYRVQACDSPVDGRPVFWLDYNQPENPRMLRGIRGEARRLRDGLLLCRMNWRDRAGELHTLLYFTLSEPAHG